MIYFLFITAFTVSIDSLVCGFSLVISEKRKLAVIAVITLTVYIMCLTANYLASLLSGILTEKTASLGGILLIGVGLFNLIKKDDKTLFKKSAASQSLITGIAVGTDGAAANLSLALMGINAFYVPIVIALMHAVMVSTGIMLSETRVAKKFSELDFLPPLILIALGFYKLTALLF